jgi:hypothetical protein
MAVISSVILLVAAIVIPTGCVSREAGSKVAVIPLDEIIQPGGLTYSGFYHYTGTSE